MSFLIFLLLLANIVLRAERLDHVQFLLVCLIVVKVVEEECKMADSSRRECGEVKKSTSGTGKLKDELQQGGGEGEENGPR